MNIIRINNVLVITTDEGTQYKTTNCTDEFYQAAMACLVTKNEEGLKRLFYPTYDKVVTLQNGIENSQYITKRGNSLYIDSISKLTVPQDFAEAVFKAEQDGDEDKIKAYLNFWTLLSLNPDSRVRDNIFWFLNRWGMVISQSGLIVGYRNVDIKHEGCKYSSGMIAYITREYAYVRYKLKKNPANYLICKNDLGEYVRCKADGNGCNMLTEIGNLAEIYKNICESQGDTATVYTDHYTHSFEIRMGQVVQMERKTCDAEQEHDCSRGLHVGGKDWLEKNYFGDVGIRVLVNPADIVAVPTQSNYGKLRTCAYYPVNVVEYDAEGHVKDQGIESGFEDDFIEQICYAGEVNNVDTGNYTLNIPDMPGIDKENMIEQLRQMAIEHGRN